MIWSLHGGILLPPTCKINHVAFPHIPVYMRHIYVNVQLSSVNMQHNFVIMIDNYVNMHLNFPVCWHKKVAILHVDIIYLACRGRSMPRYVCTGGFKIKYHWIVLDFWLTTGLLPSVGTLQEVRSERCLFTNMAGQMLHWVCIYSKVPFRLCFS